MDVDSVGVGTCFRGGDMEVGNGCTIALVYEYMASCAIHMFQSVDLKVITSLEIQCLPQSIYNMYIKKFRIIIQYFLVNKEGEMSRRLDLQWAVAGQLYPIVVDVLLTRKCMNRILV